MIERDHKHLSIRYQCDLLALSRSGLYRPERSESEENLRIMRWVDEKYFILPTLGVDKLTHLARQELDLPINAKRIARLKRKMGLETIYPRKRLSIPGHLAERYPYLLAEMKITRPNQVWCTDITYIPMRRGFMYLVAVLDWHSRKVLSWKLSNTLDTGFCLKAVDEAIENAGCTPEVFNTDQGCQFTSSDWVDRMKELEIKISQDGKGRWLDNVRIERFWWSLKYEDVYLRSYESPVALEAGIEKYINLYNSFRPHEALENKTPNEVYGEKSATKAA